MSEKYQQKLAWLRHERTLLDPTFQEISDLFTPFRGDLYGGSTNSRRKQPYDPTGVLAADKLVNFFIASLFSSSFDWLSLRQRGEVREDQAIQQALDDTSLRILDALADSNFYSTATAWVTDWTVIGNGTNYVQHDEEGVTGDEFGGLVFDPIPWTRMWWTFSHIGRPFCLLCEKEMPAIEALNFLSSPGDNPGSALRDKAKNTPYELVCLYHLVERDYNGKKGTTKKPWKSYWYVGEQYHLAREGGYDENPYICARQMILDGEQYGRGRGHIARPYARGVNVMTYQELISLGKELNPPFVSEEESIIEGDPIPSGHIIIRPPKEFAPQYVKSGTNFRDVEEIRRYYHQQIKEAFLGDVLSEPDTQTRSAAAEQSRLNRAITRVSSVNHTVVHEMLSPLIETVIDIMLKRGALPELESIGGLTVKPVFTSPFFSAQKATSATRVHAFLERRLQLWERTSDPAWLDDLDQDEIRAYDIDMTDVPARIFKEQQEVNAIRAARGEQAAQDRILQMQQQAISGRAGRNSTQVQLRPGGSRAAGEGLAEQAQPPGVAV